MVDEIDNTTSNDMFSGIKARLERMTDDELWGIVAADTPSGPWGASGPATVDEATVFLKRVPLTDREAASPYSTLNHFKLPTYYSYGVGSAGFGVWRELAAHELTGNLDGFPQLLHHRVMPRSAEPGKLPWSGDDYVHYWNGNRAIGEFMAARNAATREVWIVLEYVPHLMFTWVIQNQDRAQEVINQLFERVDSLRALGIVHFDAHLANVVTDGDTCRLTDFGLAIADRFELRAAEREFLARHAHYDYGLVLASFGLILLGALGEPPSGKRLAHHIDDIERLPIAYQPELIDVFRRYREPMSYMVGVFERLQQPSKRARYDDGWLVDLLRAVDESGSG